MAGSSKHYGSAVQKYPPSTIRLGKEKGSAKLVAFIWLAWHFSALIDNGHISKVCVAAGDGGRKTNQRKARMGDNITHFVNRCQMPGRSCWWVIPAPIATMAAVADRVIIEGDMTV